MFIAIEGVDGGGKSSLISMLEKHYESQSIEVALTREPGGTPLAESLRNSILDDYEEEEVHKPTEVLVMLAARIQHCFNLIIPKLNNGMCVITDRFEASTFVYQCKDNQAMHDAYLATKKLMGLTLVPNVSFVLDIPYDVFEKRIDKRAEKNRLDPMNKERFDDIREGYMNYVNQTEHAILIDASGTEEETFMRVLEHLSKLKN